MPSSVFTKSLAGGGGGENRLTATPLLNRKTAPSGRSFTFEAACLFSTEVWARSSRPRRLVDPTTGDQADNRR